MKQAALISSLTVATIALGGLAVSATNASGNEVPPAGDARTASEHVIELAICLDTSGSMDGLINSARQKLWTIVNDLAKAEPTPTLRVALLSYGNDGNNPENGWVKVETPFTEDLDVCRTLLDEAQVRMAGPQTVLGDAVGLAITVFERSELEDRVLILLTDGNLHRPGSEDPLEVAPRARRWVRVRQVQFLVYGVGQADDSVLRLLAAGPPQGVPVNVW